VEKVWLACVQHLLYLVRVRFQLYIIYVEKFQADAAAISFVSCFRQQQMQGDIIIILLIDDLFAFARGHTFYFE